MGGAWWLIATVAGLILGTPARAAEAIAPALRGARTATSLPDESDGRIAFMRLWPIGAFAVVCGVAGVFLPQVAAIGAGYAILIALLWRRREEAVLAIEDRDGVRFYVEPTSAFEPHASRSHAGAVPGSAAASEASASAAGRGVTARAPARANA